MAKDPSGQAAGAGHIGWPGQLAQSKPSTWSCKSMRVGGGAGSLFSPWCHGVEFDPGVGGGVTQTEKGEAGADSGSGCISGGWAYFMGAFCLYMQGR